MTRLGTVGRPTARLRDKGRCSLGAAGGRVRAQPQAVPVHPPPPPGPVQRARPWAAHPQNEPFPSPALPTETTPRSTEGNH